MANIVEMPKLGFDMAEGTLVRWVKLEGETIQKGDVLAEIETDKATVEVESNFSGIVFKHLAKEKESLPIGTPIAVIAEKGEKVDLSALLGKSITKPSQPAQKSPIPSQETAAVPSLQRGPSELEPSQKYPQGVKASPLARNIAKAAQIDLSLITGSGPGGRIVKRDVEAFFQSSTTAPKPSSAIPSSISSKRDVILPVSRLRGIIGKRMSEAKQLIPHFYVTHTYDVEKLINLRQEMNQVLGEEVKLSLNDFIVKAVALTLREFPNLNATLKDDQIIQHGNINIGVAVAVEGGLLTVVSRDADQKPLRLLSAELSEMAQRARSGKVRPEDVEGATFSISNLGMFDVEHFVAIINPPQAAILAVASAKEVPVVKEGKLTIGRQMNATLSVDHRISDGAEAAQFLQALAVYLESPMKILI